MSCGLSDDALQVLYILYHSKCFRDDRGYHSKKLEKIISKKIHSNFEDVIKELKREGHITQIKKKEIKFYISDMPRAIGALNLHGFPVTPGKVRKL
jgi:hypothetical protein